MIFWNFIIKMMMMMIVICTGCGLQGLVLVVLVFDNRPVVVSIDNNTTLGVFILATNISDDDDDDDDDCIFVMIIK